MSLALARCDSAPNQIRGQSNGSSCNFFILNAAILSKFPPKHHYEACAWLSRACSAWCFSLVIPDGSSSTPQSWLLWSESIVYILALGLTRTSGQVQSMTDLCSPAPLNEFSKRVGMAIIHVRDFNLLRCVSFSTIQAEKMFLFSSCFFFLASDASIIFTSFFLFRQR